MNNVNKERLGPPLLIIPSVELSKNVTHSSSSNTSPRRETYRQAPHNSSIPPQVPPRLLKQQRKEDSRHLSTQDLSMKVRIVDPRHRSAAKRRLACHSRDANHALITAALALKTENPYKLYITVPCLTNESVEIARKKREDIETLTYARSMVDEIYRVEYFK